MPDCEGPARVSVELVGPQREFPTGLHVLELSWKRSPEPYMRIRLTECPHDSCYQDPYEWLLTEIMGKWVVIGASPGNGRMLVRARCRVLHNGGRPKAQCWKPRKEDLSLVT